MINFASDKTIKNMTTPISDNFETRIINELMLAQQSIKIAVAWFNSKNILDILCWKLRGGVNVEIILHYDDVNSGSESSLDFSEYKQLGGILVWAKAEKSTMHVKFCIIDDRVLLHGSCNWTYRAFKKNDEILNITTEEPETIKSYCTTFLNLKEKYNSPVSLPPRTAYTTQNRIRKSPKNESVVEVHNSLSIDKRRQMFFQALQPFELKYDKDYLETFSEYWLTEYRGKFRIEVDESGNRMNMLGITPEYMNILLENWKPKYDIIVIGRQSSFIMKEIGKEVRIIEGEYERKNIELRCNTAMDEHFIFRPGNRLLGKVLYDKGLYLKRHYEYDRFLQKGIYVSLCYPIKSIEEEEQRAFSDFCLVYEANQAFKRVKDYNNSILSQISKENTYRAFCDKYGIYYGHSLKKEKTIKEMIDSLRFPVQLEYNGGAIDVVLSSNGNQRRLLKLNEVYGLQLLTIKLHIATYFRVPHKVLYTMDGTQYDFRDDSFENGTMKSIKLPQKYKDGQFYVDKIEEILSKN